MSYYIITLEACEKAMDMARDMEDKRLEIDVLHMTGGVHMVRGDMLLYIYIYIYKYTIV